MSTVEKGKMFGTGEYRIAYCKTTDGCKSCGVDDIFATPRMAARITELREWLKSFILKDKEEYASTLLTIDYDNEDVEHTPCINIPLSAHPLMMSDRVDNLCNSTLRNMAGQAALHVEAVVREHGASIKTVPLLIEHYKDVFDFDFTDGKLYVKPVVSTHIDLEELLKVDSAAGYDLCDALVCVPVFGEVRTSATRVLGVYDSQWMSPTIAKKIGDVVVQALTDGEEVNLDKPWGMCGRFSLPMPIYAMNAEELTSEDVVFIDSGVPKEFTGVFTVALSIYNESLKYVASGYVSKPTHLQSGVSIDEVTFKSEFVNIAKHISFKTNEDLTLDMVVADTIEDDLQMLKDNLSNLSEVEKTVVNTWINSLGMSTFTEKA